MEIMHIAEHITAIDHDLLGVPGIGVTYLVRGDDLALIETGTAATVPNTLAALEQLGVASEAVGHILCTHIHLDHAGGAGALARALPRATVAIHTATGQHLVDPSRLLPSTRRAVGELLWPLYGDLVPVDASRIRPAETLLLDLGRDVVLEAMPTPGHSPDHVSFWERRSGGLFIGDAAGIALPRFGIVSPVTPPPAYDLTTQLATIAMLRGLDISQLYFTHYGAVEDAASTLRELDESLQALAAGVSAALDAGDEDVAPLTRRLLPSGPLGMHSLVIDTWAQMSVAGMLRWEKKRRGL